jgi:hypothetical protein
MSQKTITLSLNLNDPNFSGLGRRKYNDKYNNIPVNAYPEDVKTVFTALYKLLKLDLTDETASLSVLASPEGFPQRLIGPKVFQTDGVLGLKVGPTFFPFTQEVTEDEIKYTLNGKNIALQADGKNPLFRLTLGGGLSIKLPVYCNINTELPADTVGYYGFAELEEALLVVDNVATISKIVGSPNAGGGSKTVFTALRNLPTQNYSVVSAKNSTGKYGATLDILLVADNELELIAQQKNPATEKWENVLVKVEPGTQIKVQGNTGLKNSLLGAELVADDKVALAVVGQEKNKEGKIVVNAFFDYENSRLKFEF